MERFIWAVRVAAKYAFDIRVLYLLAGLILSVVAHEMVHVLLHLGGIQSVHLFPDFKSIVSINVNYVDGYNIDKEEVLAYAVTVLVQLITIIDVLAIHDSRNTKTASQVLFGGNDDMSEHEKAVLLQLVSK